MTTQSLQLVAGHLIRLGRGGPSLTGSRCRDCGEHYFPIAGNCTRCCSADLEPCDLGDSGRLWSWTVQGFLPKSPYNSGETAEDFRAYGVGYVQMACGVKVESRLTSADPQVLAIGMPMRLVIAAYGHDAAGAPLQTYAFAPAEGDN